MARGLAVAGYDAAGVLCDVTDFVQFEVMILRTFNQLDAACSKATMAPEVATIPGASNNGRPGDKYQPVWRLELHEKRTSPDDGAGERNDREKPEEIAAVVVWLGNSATRFMTSHAHGGVLAD